MSRPAVLTKSFESLTGTRTYGPAVTDIRWDTVKLEISSRNRIDWIRDVNKANRIHTAIRVDEGHAVLGGCHELSKCGCVNIADWVELQTNWKGGNTLKEIRIE
jgi:uncharacterized ubiquitin-like protein YukD